METIYFKSSHNRKDKYQIDTSILMDGKNRFAIKHSKNDDEFTDKIIQNYSKLIGNSGDITIIKPVKIDNKTVKFKFIFGETLQNKFIRLIKAGEIKPAMKIISRIEKHLISCSIETKNFPTLETHTNDLLSFDLNLKEEKYTYPANIDYNLDNLIETDLGIFLIDYEWVLSNPVPVSFIMFRLIFNLIFELDSKSLDYSFLVDIYSKYKSEEFIQKEYEFQSKVHSEIDSFKLFKKKFDVESPIDFEVKAKPRRIELLETENFDLRRKMDMMEKERLEIISKLQLLDSELRKNKSIKNSLKKLLRKS